MIQKSGFMVCILFLFILQIGCRENGSLSPFQSTMQKIQATHELHIGYLVFSPTVIRDPNNGKLSGFFIDMVEFMAKNLNAKVIYHETTLKDFSAGLNTRQFDLSICATYRTIARAEAVAFTQPIFYLGNGAVVRKDAADKFNKNTDFNNGNVHIAVLQGQAIHEYARVNFPKAKLIVLASGDLTAPLLEVSVGRADVGFCNYLDAERYAAAHPEVVDIFKDNPIEMVPLGWAVRSDDLVWLNFVNTAIDYMESTGRIGAWEKSYGTPLLHEKKSIELR